MVMNDSQLQEAAAGLAELLEQTGIRIVFAESCTGGLVAASLAAIPGISRWLCGSAVTYQEQTKVQWLGVSDAQLQQHSAVSSEVTVAMAQGALRQTSQADLAVAVTGHLGPGAPDRLDGVIFMAAVFRAVAEAAAQSECLQLNSSQRKQRQHEAAQAVLRMSHRVIEQKNR
jgi:nicotinamide-nucleotide amidase